MTILMLLAILAVRGTKWDNPLDLFRVFITVIADLFLIGIVLIQFTTHR